MQRVEFRFDDKTAQSLQEIIRGKVDGITYQEFLRELEIQVGTFLVLKEQKRAEESSKEVELIIQKNRNNVNALLNSLNQLSTSEESLNRLHMLMPAYKSSMERVEAAINRNNDPLPNLVRDMFKELNESLFTLDSRLLQMKALGDQLKKNGRPSKDLLKSFIRHFTQLYEYYIGKRNLTREGDFESVIKICLDACGEPKEDVHGLILSAFEK